MRRFRKSEQKNLSGILGAERSKVGQQLAEEVGQKKVLFIYCKMGCMIINLDDIRNNSCMERHQLIERRSLMNLVLIRCVWIDRSSCYKVRKPSV